MEICVQLVLEKFVFDILIKFIIEIWVALDYNHAIVGWDAFHQWFLEVL